jgi:hypothetical protein
VLVAQGRPRINLGAHPGGGGRRGHENLAKRAAKRGMTPQECYAYEQQGIQDYEY